MRSMIVLFQVKMSLFAVYNHEFNRIDEDRGT